MRVIPISRRVNIACNFDLTRSGSAVVRGGPRGDSVGNPEPSAQSKDFKLRRVLLCRGNHRRLFQPNRPEAAIRSRQQAGVHAGGLAKASVIKHQAQRVSGPFSYRFLPHALASQQLLADFMVVSNLIRNPMDGADMRGRTATLTVGRFEFVS
jgi:hypothetical protein